MSTITIIDHFDTEGVETICDEEMDEDQVSDGEVINSHRGWQSRRFRYIHRTVINTV